MPRASQVYPDKKGKTPSRSTSTRSERRGSRSFKQQIETVKNGVRIEQEARARGDFKLLGNDRLLGHCVSPTHTDRTASMTVYTDTQTFKCYGLGCGAQGDVLDLVMLAEPEMELWEAMVYLSTRYGTKLPERPTSWNVKQERQRPVRDGIEAAKIQVARRRLYRRFFEPLILATTNEEDRAHDAQVFWEATEPLAEHLITSMMESQW